MPTIDPTARIADGAVIGDGAEIGPYCIIGPNVVIGENCKLIAHVHVAGRTTIGAGCTVYPFASLGASAQIIGLDDELGQLEIGVECTIRESATMNAGSPRGGGITRVGARGFFMNCTHVGHDCVVGDDVVFATSATLGGHCEIGNHVFIGGLSAVHQHTRIGQGVMVGGISGVAADIIPNALVNGQRANLRGLNLIGMKRRQMSSATRSAVKAFYQRLFLGSGVFAERLAEERSKPQDEPAIVEILAFIEAGNKRELCMPPAARD